MPVLPASAPRIALCGSDAQTQTGQVRSGRGEAVLCRVRAAAEEGDGWRGEVWTWGADADRWGSVCDLYNLSEVWADVCGWDFVSRMWAEEGEGAAAGNITKGESFGSIPRGYG